MSNRKPHQDFKRKSKVQLQHQRILVVCEDSKTSPSYFEQLCQELKLNTTVGIKITGKCDSTPDQVLKAAKAFYDQDLKENPKDSYDKIYLVIDRDDHSTYSSVVEQVSSKSIYKGSELILAHSVRCFELWVLLHFKQTTKHFDSSEAIVAEIRKFITDYDKVNTHLYDVLGKNERIAIAIKNAGIVNAQAEDIHQPQCHIDKLVLDLFAQAKEELPKV
jgi:hypothetical protein